MRLGAAALVAVMAGSCGGSGAPMGVVPDQLKTTKWVSYHHWADEPPCQEALDELDALIDFSVTKFGVNPRRVDYYKFRESESARVVEICNGRVEACSQNTNAFSSAWAHDHEVVHTVWHQLGDPPQLFVEGIAVVLGCGATGFAGSPINLAADLEHAIESDEWAAQRSTAGATNYDAAGSLVRWLIDTQGTQAFVDFYSKASHDGKVESLATFKEVFGLSWADALAAWRASGPPPSGSSCLLGNDPCDAPASLTTQATLTRSLSCVPVALSVEAPAGQALSVAVSSSELPISVVLESCAPQAEDATAVIAAELDDTSGIATTGKDVELRAFGLGTRGRVRVSPARKVDLQGALRDPEGYPFAGKASGTVTFKKVTSPEAVFGATCPSVPFALGSTAWAAQVTGPVSMLPAAGAIVHLKGPAFRVLDQYTFGARADYRCLSSCGATCPAGATVTDTFATLTKLSNGATRFSLGWTVGR